MRIGRSIIIPAILALGAGWVNPCQLGSTRCGRRGPCCPRGSGPHTPTMRRTNLAYRNPPAPFAKPWQADRGINGRPGAFPAVRKSRRAVAGALLAGSGCPSNSRYSFTFVPVAMRLQQSQSLVLRSHHPARRSPRLVTAGMKRTHRKWCGRPSTPLTAGTSIAIRPRPRRARSGPSTSGRPIEGPRLRTGTPGPAPGLACGRLAVTKYHAPDNKIHGLMTAESLVAMGICTVYQRFHD